jgi:hypothetical protein
MAFESILLLLENGAGGHLTAADEEEVCALAANIGVQGWVFGCRSGGYRRGRRRRRERSKIIEVLLISVCGEPDPNCMAAALEAAGRRHGVVYQLAGSLPEPGQPT